MSETKSGVLDAAEGLAFERALFEAEGPQIGVWTAAKIGLVCPGAYDRRQGFATAAARSDRAGWPVHLRPTGGGVVPQGPGIDNLVLAFNAPSDATIDDIYRMLVGIIKDGIGAHGDTLKAGDTPGSFCDGAWNLSADGKKIVGTAQRWRPKNTGRPRILAHAMILTRDTFADGARAVARFHEDLGLPPVIAEAHTSLEAAFGQTELPVEALCRAARRALVP